MIESNNVVKIKSLNIVMAISNILFTIFLYLLAIYNSILFSVGTSFCQKSKLF